MKKFKYEKGARMEYGYAASMIAERLEAIWEELHEIALIGDAMGSQRAFGPGGAPVVPPGQPGSEERDLIGIERCQKTEGCALFAGHGGICAVPKRTCQCMKPDFDIGGKCTKCKLPQAEWEGPIQLKGSPLPTPDEVAKGPNPPRPGETFTIGPAE